MKELYDGKTKTVLLDEENKEVYLLFKVLLQSFK